MFYFQLYEYAADIAVMSICLVFLMLLHSSYNPRSSSLTIFNTCVLLLLFSSMLSTSFHVLMRAPGPSTVRWIYILRFLCYVSLAVIFHLFNIYILLLIRVDKSVRKTFFAGLAVLFLLFIVCEIWMPVLKRGFYIDEQYQVHEAMFEDVFGLAYLLYAAVTLFILFYYRKKFITKIWNCILCVMSLSFVVVFIEALVQSTSFICLSFLFPILAGMFLFHYNPYDPGTGSLDHRSFLSYVGELKGRDYTMVALNLEGVVLESVPELSEEFFHFNEKYFKQPIIFRIHGSRMILVFRDKDNPNAKEKLDELLADFEKLYEKYHLDFKIVILHSDDEMKDGDDYLDFIAMLESRMALNSAYHAVHEDVEAYREQSFIKANLEQIVKAKDLNDERVRAYVQPVYDVSKGTFNTAEALMRLQLPELGLVYPDRFIYLAEQEGCIHELSLIILNKTCQQILQLEKEGYRIERVSVNFSMLELKNPNFCNDVLEVIRSNGISYSKIAIELTESQNEYDFENVRRIMARMHGMGIKFYLDDFGTGYSNFDRIMKLPIDIIKFDRSLTIMSSQNDEQRFMVSNFAEIFANSDYQVLFEGVEDENDEVRCLDMGARYLQGYKYSKPIPMWQLRDFLERVY